MQEAKTNELSNIAALFEQHHVALYHYFLRMGNSPAHSEDLVQESFIKVMMYRESFNGISSFKAWLYGIARNTAADHYRKDKRAPEATDPATLDCAQNSTLQEEAERTQQHDNFALALTRIPAELRDILVLHRYQQLQYDEIASLLNCNLNTLKSKMRKAVNELHLAYTNIVGEAL